MEWIALEKDRETNRNDSMKKEKEKESKEACQS